MYVIVARIKALPDAGDRYEMLIRGVVAECARHPCLVQFHIHRGDADSSEFLLYEVWTDKPNYDRLRDEPFFQSYLRERSELIESRIDRTAWTLLEAVPPISTIARS